MERNGVAFCKKRYINIILLPFVFIEVLQKWSLFGSSFFAVRRVSDPGERCEHILALNKNGVHFLDVMTHVSLPPVTVAVMAFTLTMSVFFFFFFFTFIQETLLHYSYSEVISTRKVKSGDGLYLDMKCGNLMQQRVTRIQTDQAHEISRLIRQYITIQQRGGQSDGDDGKNMAASR